MQGRAAVLLNDSSRSTKAAAQHARLDELLRSSALAAELFRAPAGSDLAALAERAARGPYDLVVAAGGDGTVNAVASALAGSEKVMGVLPLGTINHFAKHLGVPMDLEAAVQSLATAEPVRVDLGDVNGHVFVNNSTLGLYPAIIRGREHLRKQRGLNKWMALAWTATKMLRRRDALEISMREGGRERRLVTPFLFVGKSDFKLGGLDLGNGRSPGDGELGVCIGHAKGGRLRTLELALRAIAGRAQSASNAEGDVRFEILETEQLVVRTAARRLHITLDGEVMALSTPLRYRVRPLALRVLAPRLQAREASPEASPPDKPEGSVAGEERR